MQEKQLLHEGKTLRYFTEGNGPVMLLLHGFGEDSSIWKNQWGAFEGYQLLVPDLPGSGASGMIEDMSMEGLARAVLQVVEAEAPGQKIVLVGHSMGGYITLAFAEHYPDRLLGFGLFHSTSYADSEERKGIRLKGIDFVERNGAAEFLRTTIPNLYGPMSKESHPEWIREHIEGSRNFSDAAIVSYYRSMISRPDRREVLEKAAVPVLMILGEYDSAVPLKDGLEQTSLPDLSYIHILRSSGHMGMIEEPLETNNILKQFLQHITKNSQPE